MFRINHKKAPIIIVVCFLLSAMSLAAQNNASNNVLKKPTLAIHFLLNDFTTANLLRQNSIGRFINHDQWQKVNKMDAGLGLSYLQGLTSHIDFGSSVHISSLDYFFRNKPIQGYESMLMESDIFIRTKLLPDQYFIVPYVDAGAGLSLYKKNIGAYVPLGMGMQLNLGKGDAFLFSDIQYRIPITSNTNFHFIYSIGVAMALVERKNTF